MVPLCMGEVKGCTVAQTVGSAHCHAGTKSKIPIKKPLDRAKMAEETFAARRTAAISRKLK